ncbi:uncharacterized protein At4g26450 isoform X2 [Diospyros lotus]|uniref:uncharacterized protein At4g26450 isoform X2 n=1 Tax=Diospyros lotus TaxID=55363 RepID=UPI00225BB267|nr:uncharacterized protein At4g26450 isoform X2 [Diospyros lotus]
MHPRNRSPGNGYRGTSMGLGGVAAASRVSSESSIRGRGMYNSEYRGYNRGFGRGQPKPFQVPQPPPRRGDIFMEAGRLATEYLVSKGMLPPNVLSGKWQNGSLKNQVGDFQGFRQQEADGLHLLPEGRTTAFARLGNVVDSGPDRRRFSDEYNPTGSRNYMRGRRRMGSIRNYGSDWGREMARSSSWSDKARASPDIEGEDNTSSGYQEEQQAGNEKSRSSEIASKKEAVGDSESMLEHLKLQDGTVTKLSSVIDEEPPSETEADLEFSKRSDNVEYSNEETIEVKDSTGSDQAGKQNALEDIPIKHSVGEGDSMNRNSGNLLSLCRFAKVPTKTRSSLTTKGSKVNSVPVSEEEHNHTLQQGGQNYEMGPPIETEVPLNNVSVGCSSIDASSSQVGSSKHLDSSIAKELPVISAEEAGEIGPINNEEGKCIQSHSFPDMSLVNQQESFEGPPGFGSSSSMIMERGEKRAVQDGDNSRDREGIKKPREWPPSLVTQTDEYLHTSNLKGKQLSSQEGTSSLGKEVILATDQDRPLDVSLFQGGDAGPCMEYTEEKQLFPSSFKTCDLNLMETSEANESTDPNPILIFPSIPERQKEATTVVGVDLSISNNCDLSAQYGRHGSDGKEVELIDLENDSERADKVFSNSERKGETVYTGLEVFSDHAQNPNGMPDVQDGYGLMLSELLGTDISNCSSVPADISIHNEMALHNGEGILGDDDSIYMSLGEIPISMPEI